MYKIADIGVIPSVYEEFGYVAVEMMMHGIPIVANKTSGLSEIVVHQVTGECIDLYESFDENHSVTLLLEAISQLLSDKKKRNFYSQKARERYIEYFSMDRFRKQMLDVYENC